MATYAPNGVTGNDDAVYSFSSGKSPNRYHLMRLMRKKGLREVGEIIFTALAENTPSDSASVTISQLTASADTTANVNGGVRTIAAVEQMGSTLDGGTGDTPNTARAAAAADVTTLNAELIPSGATANRQPGTYPVDASGNGGGGKLD
jgi:hypothetical protein